MGRFFSKSANVIPASGQGGVEGHPIAGATLGIRAHHSVDVIPCGATVGRDSELRSETVGDGQGSIQNRVAVAILATHFQCSNGCRKGIDARHIPGVSDVFHRELEDRAKFTNGISGVAGAGHLSGDVQRLRVAQSRFFAPQQFL